MNGGQNWRILSRKAVGLEPAFHRGGGEGLADRLIAPDEILVAVKAEPFRREPSDPQGRWIALERAAVAVAAGIRDGRTAAFVQLPPSNQAGVDGSWVTRCVCWIGSQIVFLEVAIAIAIRIAGGAGGSGDVRGAEILQPPRVGDGVVTGGQGAIRKLAGPLRR